MSDDSMPVADQSAASIADTANDPSSEANSASELRSSAADVSESRPRDSGSHVRELPISTVVHLMGLPTAKQVELLESKVDAISTRLQLVNQKVDRISAQLNQAIEALLAERIENQLAEIRAVLKKLFPKALASGELLSEESSETSGMLTGQRVTLSSGGSGVRKSEKADTATKLTDDIKTDTSRSS